MKKLINSIKRKLNSIAISTKTAIASTSGEGYIDTGVKFIIGVVIGGVILGVIENLTKAYISSQMADAIVFAVLIVVLLVKPTGLLGKQIQEKV